MDIKCLNVSNLSFASYVWGIKNRGVKLKFGVIIKATENIGCE